MDLEVASAGIHALSGQGVPEVVRELLLRRGIDVSAHRGRQLDRTLAEWADLILVMDSYQMGVVESLFPTTRGKVTLLPEFSPGGGSEVADPFGGAEGDYAACLALIDESVRGVLKGLCHRDARRISQGGPRAMQRPRGPKEQEDGRPPTNTK